MERFPKPTNAGKSLEWLSGFQEEFLSNTRNAYYTNEKCSDSTGTEAKRQVDFFVKRKSDAASTTYDWKDIHVIGGHKQSQSDFRPLLYTPAQPNCGLLDRSGPYSSGELDIHQEPKNIIGAIAGYAMSSNEELGLDTFIEPNGEDQLITITDNMTGKKKELQLDQNPFVKQRAIVSRGTSCYRTSDQETVVKFSWTSDKRSPEAKYLNLARERGVTGLTSLFGHHQRTSIKEQRNGLEFPAAHRFRKGNSGALTPFSRSKSQPRSLGAFGHFSIIEGTSEKRRSTTPDNKESKRSRSSGQKS